MAASTPIALNTRSAQRKRKTPVNLVASIDTSEQQRVQAEAAAAMAAATMADPDQLKKVLTTSPTPVTSSTNKSSGSSDNNQAELPADGEDASVVVLKKEDLVRFQDTDVASEQLTKAFSSEDWQDQFEGITIVRQLVRCHPESGFVYEHLEQVIKLLTLGVGSLRSALSRNALFSIGELFEQLPTAAIAYSKGDEESKQKTKAASSAGPALLESVNVATMDALVDAVIIKSVNEKRFIAVAGETVVAKMVKAVPCRTLLRPMLRHSDSKSPKVCSIVARYGTYCLKDMLAGPEAKALVEDDSTNVVVAFANLQVSRSVEAKQPAAKSLRMLHNALAAQTFGIVISKNMSPAQAAKIMAIVNNPAVGARNNAAKKPSIKEIMAKKRLEMIAAAAAVEKAADQKL